MAQQKKKSVSPAIGFYEEPDFVSLTTSLRNISDDKTLPSDEYVDMYKNLYDLIIPEEKESAGGVIDIQLSEDKTQLIIFYHEKTTNIIQLSDTFLYYASFSVKTCTAYFVRKNGETLELDLNALKDIFITYEEARKIIQEEIRNIYIEDNREIIKEEVRNVFGEESREIIKKSSFAAGW